MDKKYFENIINDLSIDYTLSFETVLRLLMEYVVCSRDDKIFIEKIRQNQLNSPE